MDSILRIGKQITRRRPPAKLHGAPPAVWRRAAFTLVELLVVIVVVALLIGITVPALGAARRQSLGAKSLANSRTLGQAIEMYTLTYRSYPFGRVGWAVPPETGTYILYGFETWSIRNCWPVLMHETAPWREFGATWVSPGADDPDRFARTWTSPIRTFDPSLVAYQLSTSFVGDPRLWDGRATAPERFVRTQTPASVVYPSQKVLAFDAERAYLGDDQGPADPRPLLLADGSGRWGRDVDAIAAVQNPLSPWAAAVYHDTPWGVRGRDVR